MNNPVTHSVAALPSPYAVRASAPLGCLWRAFVNAVRRLRPGRRAPNRDAAEREALAGLSAHVLRDIGASPWLVADAAARVRDAAQANVDGRLY